jgi:hypothetical protein
MLHLECSLTGDPAFRKQKSLLWVGSARPSGMTPTWRARPGALEEAGPCQAEWEWEVLRPELLLSKAH